MSQTQLLPVHVDQGTGQAVVLLHGLGNNYHSWDHVLKKMPAGRCRLIALDLLGFGDAPKPRNIAYTPQDHAQAVADTLDKLNVTEAVVAGHSMGAIVAIALAKLRPDLVKQLILLGAPLYDELPKPQRSWLKRWRRPEGVYFSIFSFLKDNPDVTIVGAKGADAMLPLLKGMEITEETWYAFRQSLVNTIMQTQPYKEASNLRTPTLLVWGVLDFFVIRSNLLNVQRANRKYIHFKTMLGPHEITPLQGKRVARMIVRAVARAST